MPGRRRADAVDQLPELAARQRVDAGGGLVEDQQVGSWIRAQHRPSFCFMPPESLPAGGRQTGRQAGGAQQVGHARLRRSAGTGRTGRPKSRFSDTDRVARRCLAQALRHVGDMRGTRRGGGRPGPCRHRAPAPGRPGLRWRRPAGPSSVDLPTPSGPIRPTMHPAGMLKLTSSSAVIRQRWVRPEPGPRAGSMAGFTVRGVEAGSAAGSRPVVPGQGASGWMRT